MSGSLNQKSGSDVLTEENIFLKRIILSSLIPFIFISILWLVKIFESLTGVDFSGYGIEPLTASGLPGIILGQIGRASCRERV